MTLTLRSIFSPGIRDKGTVGNLFLREMISTVGSCACLCLSLAPSNFIWLAPLLHYLELAQGARPRAGCSLMRAILGRLPEW